MAVSPNVSTRPATYAGPAQIGSLSRDDWRRFDSLVAQLSPQIGKSFRNRSLGLEQLVANYERAKIRTQTQKRIVFQVYHFLDWAYHEGHIRGLTLVSDTHVAAGVSCNIACSRSATIAPLTTVSAAAAARLNLASSAVEKSLDRFGLRHGI